MSAFLAIILVLASFASTVEAFGIVKKESILSGVRIDLAAETMTPSSGYVKMGDGYPRTGSLLRPGYSGYYDSFEACEEKCNGIAECDGIVFNPGAKYCDFYNGVDATTETRNNARDRHLFVRTQYDPIVRGGADGQAGKHSTSLVDVDEPRVQTQYVQVDGHGYPRTGSVLSGYSGYDSFEACEKKCNRIAECDGIVFNPGAKYCDFYNGVDATTEMDNNARDRHLFVRKARLLKM